jgi:[ribosomal protein S5]-alanine N-acetyltransferase
MLIGKHIRLAEYETSFAPLITEWTNDPEYFGPFYNIWPSTQPQWEEELAKSGDDTQASFVIKARDDDRPLGTIGYITPSTLPSLFRGLEIWYQVHPKERGRGVATQAAAILVDHLFSARPHQRVQATVVGGNDGSARVLERIGMRHEGVLRQNTFLRGEYVDLNLYSIVRNDWKSEADYRTRFDFLESQ